MSIALLKAAEKGKVFNSLFPDSPKMPVNLIQLKRPRRQDITIKSRVMTSCMNLCAYES